MAMALRPLRVLGSGAVDCRWLGRGVGDGCIEFTLVGSAQDPRKEFQDYQVGAVVQGLTSCSLHL